MWMKTLLALTLSAPMLACSQSACGDIPGNPLSTQFSGSASIALDSPSSVEQGTLGVTGFGVAETTLPGHLFEVSFNLGRASSIACLTTKAQVTVSAGTSALAEFCSSATLTLGGAQAMNVDVTGVSGTVTSSSSADSSGNVTTNVTLDLDPTTLTTSTGSVQLGATHLEGSEVQAGPTPADCPSSGSLFGNNNGSWQT